jgi:1-acyl-sn-glycerol-3-phosphate acyltransferase
MSVPANSHDHDSLHSGLQSAAFQGLLWTQFFGAINDNVFRWFVIGIGKTQYMPENLGTLLVIGSSFFIVPYIVFASVAGWLADRFSKRNVIVVCKVAEIVIMVAGVVAVSMMGTPNPAKGVDPCFYLLLAVVFFMGAQSALFAPSKIGTIPELLDEHSISRGNGYFNLFTLTATIIGMVGGGWLSDVTNQGRDKLWVAAAVLVGLAVVGTLASFFTKSLGAANPSAKFPVTLIGENIRDLVTLFRNQRIVWFAVGVAFFWSIAAFVQLNIDAFAEESGSLTESDRNPLLVAVVIGIAMGSVLAGYLSVGRIELGLVPIGAIGIAVFALMLSFAPPDFITGRLMTTGMITGCVLLFGLGVFAGIFNVPLEAYVQHNSPIESRGSILSATNCLAFGGVLLMFGVLEVMRRPTYDGSMDKIEKQFTAASLKDPDEKAELEELKRSYEEQLRNTLKDPEIKVDSNSVPPGLAIRKFTERFQGERSAFRDIAITELAHHDATVRRELKRTLPVSSYVTEWEPSSMDRKAAAAVGKAAPALDRSAARLVKKGSTQAGKLPWLTSRQVFLSIAFMTLPIIAFAFWKLARQTARLTFWGLFKALYRIRVNGAENIPQNSGAIVVANHSSWLDGAIMLVLVPRIPRTLAWAGNFSSWAMKKWADFCGVILITGGPKSIKEGLKRAKETVKNGEIIGIFPEGSISPSGQLRAFKPGLSKILDEENPAPIIPAYFAETYGSLFSYSGGRVFRKWPDTIRRPLSVHFGKPIQYKSMFELHQAVQRLSVEAMEKPAGNFTCPGAQFIYACKRRKFKSKIADSTDQEEKGGSLLTRCLVLRRLLREHVLGADEQNVGVLIPPSLGGAIVNLTLALDRRVAINLNYTLSVELINYCIKKAGIRHVLTSRKVMEKFDLQLDCEVIYLDDLKDKVTTGAKIVSAMQSYLMPASLLVRYLKLSQVKPQDLMTIVFTSGSTGVPKGVMLSQKNIMTNVQAINQVAAFVPQDTMVGILPFFHSMGYTATLWAPMICNIRGVYHFSPLDAKVIGKLVEKYSGTVIIATPTFLRSFTRRCTPEQFKTINAVVAGAERLPVELCDEFEQKFNVRPVEGYGTTELSPITAVNIPPSRQLGSKHQPDNKEGTVGRPIPFVAAKVTDLDTGAELGPNQSGMLWIKGPNVMIGYLDMPKETAEVLVDGWYKTGDVAIIDDQGFIKITGRMSRFSKIGGEMVPHLKIEEVLSAFLDQNSANDADNVLSCAVTAVADEKKGERLIVLYAETPHSVDSMIGALKSAGLPNIFIPSPDSFYKVDQLPILGTGKLDLKGIRDLANQLTASG